MILKKLCVLAFKFTDTLTLFLVKCEGAKVAKTQISHFLFSRQG